ncbi:hypothetical protein ACFJIW_14585 [Tahibacter sp. UC22_41]|uniref:hypothetical protein n=1 Tax=Tahibacter sp. UC22_41 TaxID=3350178 RepID=UPI0036D978E3
MKMRSFSWYSLRSSVRRFFELADDAAEQHLRQRVGRRGLAAAELRLGLDALLLRRGQARVDALQFLRRRRLLLVDADDALLLGERHELLLGVLELELELLQAFLEVVLRVGRRVEAPVDVGRDERVGDRIGHRRGERRVEAVELDAHEARVAHRLDR